MQTIPVLLVLVVAAAVPFLAAPLPRPSYDKDFRTLSNFESLKHHFNIGKGGVYLFFYHAGDSERQEERDEDGKVSGHFAFLAPEGIEYKFKYEADEDGYQVDSDALPIAPEDTEDVKQAKEVFFDAYQRALERAEEDDYEYSAEDSEEDDDEDENEESSEESSEEDSDEEDSDDEEEEEEEEEEENGTNGGYRQYLAHFGLRS